MPVRRLGWGTRGCNVVEAQREQCVPEGCGEFQKEVRENVLLGFSEVHFVAHVTAVNVRTKVLFDCLKVLFYFCEV